MNDGKANIPYKDSVGLQSVRGDKSISMFLKCQHISESEDIFTLCYEHVNLGEIGQKWT